MLTALVHCILSKMEKVEYSEMVPSHVKHRRCSFTCFIKLAIPVVMLILQVLSLTGFWAMSNHELTVDVIRNLSNRVVDLETRLAEKDATTQEYLFHLQTNQTGLKHLEKLDAKDDQRSSETDENLREHLQQHLQDIDTEIKDLVATMSHPVNIYERCITIRDSCTAGSSGNGRFWKACPTKFFAKDEPVSVCRTKSRLLS